MLCLIKIVDGVPFEHPMLVENYLQIFPDTDLSNLPEGIAWFERKYKPELPENSVFVQPDPIYQFDGTVWTDVWLIRDMTEQEIEQARITAQQMKIQTMRELYNLNYQEYSLHLEECSEEDQRQLLQTCLNEITNALSVIDEATTIEELPKIRYPVKNESGVWEAGPVIKLRTKEEIAALLGNLNN